MYDREQKLPQSPDMSSIVPFKTLMQTEVAIPLNASPKHEAACRLIDKISTNGSLCLFGTILYTTCNTYNLFYRNFKFEKELLYR